MPEHSDLRGIATTAQIGGHPIHPLLVPIPIGLFVGMLLADIAFVATADPFWAGVALWALAAAIVFALVAAVAGFLDFFGNKRIREHRDAWLHMGGNLAAVVLALISLWLRWDSPETAVLPWGLVLSLIIVAGLIYTGWMGGELAYRHRVGMQPDERSAP